MDRLDMRREFVGYGRTWRSLSTVILRLFKRGLNGLLALIQTQLGYVIVVVMQLMSGQQFVKIVPALALFVGGARLTF